MSKRKMFNPYPPRFLAVCGFFALAAGTALNLVFGADFPESIVPHTNEVTPLVNGFCALLSLVLIFLPDKVGILLTVLVTQSVYDVLTGFELLGMFHFLLANLILMCQGFYKSKAKRKAAVIFSAWFLLLLALIPFGLERYIFAFAVTVFMLSAFMYIYHLLAHQLSFLLPNKKGKPNQPVALPRSGILNLSDLGLNERQCRCVLAIKDGNPSYKKLGEQLFISESAIKKDMIVIFDTFGVQNKEQLRIILNQYQIVQ